MPSNCDQSLQLAKYPIQCIMENYLTIETFTILAHLLFSPSQFMFAHILRLLQCYVKLDDTKGGPILRLKFKYSVLKEFDNLNISLINNLEFHFHPEKRGSWHCKKHWAGHQYFWNLKPFFHVCSRFSSSAVFCTIR